MSDAQEARSAAQPHDLAEELMGGSVDEIAEAQNAAQGRESEAQSAAIVKAGYDAEDYPEPVEPHASTVPENKKAPCNICGRGWPYHHDACAYKQTAIECNRYREALERIANQLCEVFPDSTCNQQRAKRRCHTCIARAALRSKRDRVG